MDSKENAKQKQYALIKARNSWVSLCPHEIHHHTSSPCERCRPFGNVINAKDKLLAEKDAEIEKLKQAKVSGMAEEIIIHHVTKQKQLESKLKTAVEALSKIKQPDFLHYICQETAKQAIQKIKGEE